MVMVTVPINNCKFKAVVTVMVEESVSVVSLVAFKRVYLRMSPEQLSFADAQHILLM